MNSNQLEPPRWPGGEAICAKCNLPSFASAKAATDSVGAFHMVAISALWQCRFCDGWHVWTSEASSSSGNFRSDIVDKNGAFIISQRIQTLINGTKKL